PYPAFVTLFRMEPDGSNFTTLYRFPDNRTAPVDAHVAVATDGRVYGINGRPDVFTIGPDGSYQQIKNPPTDDDKAVGLDFPPQLIPAPNGDLYAINRQSDRGRDAHLC